VRPLHRRRLALALVTFAWLAQQFGFAAHGSMQVSAALAGPFGEICTSTGLAPARGDPSEHRAHGSTLCDLCTAASLPALASAPALGLPVSVSGPAIVLAPPAAHPRDSLRRANRSRAPPLLLA
jgi:hypothetical protein